MVFFCLDKLAPWRYNGEKERICLIRLRPHHGLCIGQFVGKGYSEEFVRNMAGLIEKLEQHPQELIELCCCADDVCKCCPHRQETGCTSGQKVERYDAACLSLCGFQEGRQISWKTFRERVIERIIRPGRLKEVCADCEWLSLCLGFYQGHGKD